MMYDKDTRMKHMPKKRELILAGWKPGARAIDEQGRSVEILSNPWWDNRHFNILVRACPGELTRLADLNALTLAANDKV
jgi:hypothetical protein